MADYRSGSMVEHSGIYVVTHLGHAIPDHEVTCVKGNRFPPCRGCGHGVAFKLVKPTKHVSEDQHLLFT
jgi:hypothetical protein